MKKEITKPIKKKNSIKTLRNKADRLYQELGKLLYNECGICGGKYSCLHHYHPKSTSTALRYEIKNGVPICAGCHTRHHMANDPEIQFGMRLFMKEKFGENWETELLQERKIHQYTKTNTQYYKTQIEILKKMVEYAKKDRQII